MKSNQMVAVFLANGASEAIPIAFFVLRGARFRIGRRGWNRQADSDNIKITEYPRCFGFIVKRQERII